MNSFGLIALGIFFCVPSLSASHSYFDGRHHEMHTKIWSVKFDHFTPQDRRTVNFTYTYHLDYYVPNGPLFIYVNDAGQYTIEWLEHGLMHDIAHAANAAMITSDNRFFRSNLPTENANTTNLIHLTVDQTINDIARLIEVVRIDLNTTNVPVILFGTGFGASLATWTKQRFPHLVQGVWSSSGVYESTVHTPEPYERTSRIIAEIGGDDCSKRLSEAFQQLEILSINRDYLYMYQQLGTCYYPNFHYDVDMGGFFAGIIQLVLDHINASHRPGIMDLCENLKTNDSNEFRAFAKWVRDTYRTAEHCLNVSFFARVAETSLTEWHEVAALAWARSNNDLSYPFVSRPAFYLRCTQLGLFSTSVNAESIFGTGIGQDLYFRGCNDIFGADFDYMLLADSVKRLNFQFGGKVPNVNGIIFTNGKLDAHFAFGITEHVVEGNQDVLVRNLADYGKSADLDSINGSDTPELTEVKHEIRETVLRWSRS